ncbi:hypothetical protein [Hoylesella shahii]|uniref:hypothetical protein n=1 Tax=Hoylesella shahii TaxID=228603 RepID=UPI0028EC4FAE|nr:hypothetical protein [Hoylesella shahii]
MSKQLIQLTLPEFAFLSDDLNGELRGRNVIIHIRTMTIIEIIERENVLLYEPNVLYHKFEYKNIFGETEKLVAMLHVCTTFDKILDKEFIKQDIIKPACEYYMKFATMADAEMLEDEI